MKKLIFPLVLATLLLSACGNDAVSETPAETDESISETVKEATDKAVDTAKDVSEKTETEVKDTVVSDNKESNENSTVANTTETSIETSKNAEATTAVATDSGEFNEPAVIQTSTTDYSKYGQVVHGWTGNGRGPEYLIRDDFDYSDVAGGLAWTGDFWTASNGVVLKVIPADGIYERIVVGDVAGIDNEPNSPYRIAANEAMGTKVYQTMSETIPLTSTKKTSINTSDADLVAFKNAYDANYGLSHNAGAVNSSLALFVDGVADVDVLGANWWSIRRSGDSWKLTINTTLDNWRWSGVHQILRYLSPDGDALYQLFYEDAYSGRMDVMPTYDDWYSYGNSQVMTPDETGNGTATWYFK